MMHKLFAAAFVASLLCAPAMADDEKSQTADATFKSLDRNSDEKLSQAETAGDPALSQHFSMLDTDSDGYLTKREYTAGMKHDKQKQPNREY